MESPVDSDQQIQASREVIWSRISSLMEAKRREADIANVYEFCGESHSTSCARTSAVLYRRKDCKSHLRTTRVVNPYGPQTEAPTGHDNNWALQERLGAAEDHLGIKPVSKDVYERIQKIENKILLLESRTPEYGQIVHLESRTQQLQSKVEVEVDTKDAKIKALKEKLLAKKGETSGHKQVEPTVNAS